MLLDLLILWDTLPDIDSLEAFYMASPVAIHTPQRFILLNLLRCLSSPAFSFSTRYAMCAAFVESQFQDFIVYIEGRSTVSLNNVMNF